MSVRSTASRLPVAHLSSPSAEFIPCFLQRLLLRQEPLFFVPVGRRATWGPPYGDPASRCRAGPMCPAVSCRPPCHSEPVTDVTGVGIRNPLTVRWMPRWMLRRHSRRDRRLKTCRWHVFLTPRRIASQSDDWLAMTGFFDSVRPCHAFSQNFQNYETKSPKVRYDR